MSQYNLSYWVTLAAAGWGVIKRYIELGLGLGISIATSICPTGTENLARIPLGRYSPKRSVGVVLRHGRLLSPQAKLLIKTMKPRFFSTHATGSERQDVAPASS